MQILITIYIIYNFIINYKYLLYLIIIINTREFVCANCPLRACQLKIIFYSVKEDKFGKGTK